jgi:anti-sigma-K factor RskA
MSRTPKDLRELAGLYALDALTPDEVEEFERFLATSPETQLELEEFRQTAASLASAETTTPPAGLKASVMDAVSSTRQERPVVVSLTRRRMSFVTASAAAAVLVMVGVSVLLAGRLRDANNDLEILSAADASTYELDGSRTPNLRVIWSAELGQAAVVTGSTEQLDGAVFALWNIRPDGVAQAIGTFDGGSDVAVFDTSSLFSEVGELAITIEPPGGSPQPTGEIVAVSV